MVGRWDALLARDVLSREPATCIFAVEVFFFGTMDTGSVMGTLAGVSDLLGDALSADGTVLGRLWVSKRVFCFLRPASRFMAIFFMSSFMMDTDRGPMPGRLLGMGKRRIRRGGCCLPTRGAKRAGCMEERRLLYMSGAAPGGAPIPSRDAGPGRPHAPKRDPGLESIRAPP